MSLFVTARSPVPQRIWIRWRGVAAAAVATALSCTGVTEPELKLGLTLSLSSLEVGDTVVAEPRLTDASGAPRENPGVAVTSSDPAIARFEPPNRVIALAPGEAELRAILGTDTARARVTVREASVRTVRFDVGNVRIRVLDSTTLAVTLLDKRGNALRGRSVSWSSGDTSIVKVTSTGVARAIGAGSAVVTATVGDVSAPLTVRTFLPVSSIIVTAPATLHRGDSARVTATVRDASGQALLDRTVTWTSSNASIVSINADGMARAIGRGSVTLTAAVEGVTGTASLAATVPVASVAVSPGTAARYVGQTVQITATPRDADGGALVGPAVTFTSTDPAIATVSATGLVTAVAPGTVNILAASEGQGATTTVTVSKVPVATVAISPSAASKLVGQSLQATAVAKDSAGNTLADRSVTYTTSNVAIARVTSSGSVVAVAPGTVTITAVAEGVSGALSLTVAPVPVHSLTLGTTSASVIAGQTLTIVPLPLDSVGGLLAGRVVTWTSSDTTIAKVSSAGVVTGISEGAATITATCEGKTATASISVRSPVHSVTVTPTAHTLLTTQTVALTATALDSAGRALAGRAMVWSSSNNAIAVVSALGVVTGVAPGTATITVSSDGRTTTSTITVLPVPVASVTVTPATATRVLSTGIQLTATTLDSIGGTLTGRTCTWSTSDATTIVVSTTGFATAAGLGTATVTATCEGKSGTATVTGIPVPVTQVTVVPSNPELLTGNTITLTATPRDSVGGALTDRLVRWASLHPTIATVDSVTGVVTGIRSGFATITATSEGKVGNATIGVVSSLYPNEPPGFVPKFEFDFTTKALSGFSFNPVWNDTAKTRLVTDGAAPKSPLQVLEFVFPVGFKDSNAPGIADRLFSPATTAVYISTWIYIKRPWEYHMTGVNKLFFVGSNQFPGNNGEIVCTLFGKDEAAADFRCGVQGPLNVGAGTTNGYFTANISSPKFALDTWHRVEVLMERSTGGLANGTMRFWVNGALVGSHTNVQYNSTTDALFDAVTINPNWGGNAAQVKTQRDIIRFDHFYYSVKP